MLRRIVSNFYRRLPVVREPQALVREHQKITASLLHVENYVSRVENYLPPSQTNAADEMFETKENVVHGPLRYVAHVKRATGGYETGIKREPGD
jgi:hypothetical protein